jgi:hypothetical protein
MKRFSKDINTLLKRILSHAYRWQEIALTIRFWFKFELFSYYVFWWLCVLSNITMTLFYRTSFIHLTILTSWRINIVCVRSKITTMLLNQSYVRVVILLLENTWMTVSFHCKGKFGPIKLVKFCHFYNERFCIFVLGVSILPLFLWFRYLYCSDWIFVLFWLDICTVLIGYLYCSDWISVLFWLDICTVLIGYLCCSDWIFVLFWLDICTVLMLWYIFLLAHVYIVLLSQLVISKNQKNDITTLILTF